MYYSLLPNATSEMRRHTPGTKWHAKRETNTTTCATARRPANPRCFGKDP